MKNLIFVLFVSLFGLASNAKTSELFYVQDIFQELESQGQASEVSASSMEIARILMADILSSEESFNKINQEDGKLFLTEEAALYVFGSLKDKAVSAVNKGLEKYYDTKWYGQEKYDKFQEKLDEKMPSFRNDLADALSIVNETLSKIDPKIVGKIIKVSGSIIGAVSSILGAAFGIPVIPGLAISIATTVLGNSYTVSGALAGAKTLLDIAEHLLRVDPNAQEQDAEAKGNALKEIAKAAKWVGEHYVNNFAEYKPSEVAAIKEALKAIGKIYAHFM